jgi:hypothetical protein
MLRPYLDQPGGHVERRSVLLAWPAGLLAALAVVGSTVFALAVLGQTGSDAASQLWGLAWMGFPVVGALIAARRPDTRIGWLLVGVGAAIATGRFGASFAAVMPAEPLSLGAYLARTLHSFEMVAFGLLALALLHFPTDRLPSARWRIPSAMIVAAVVAFPIGTALGPSFDLVPGDAASGAVPNPYAIPATGVLSVAAPLLAMALLVVVLDLIRRAVRSRGVERQQLKWLAYAGGVFLAAVIASLALGAFGFDDNGAVLIIVAWVVCFNGIAAAMGVAVLRYRLYDIDRVASRTVTYLVVTLVLAGTYALAVLALGQLMSALTGQEGGDLVVAASTLAAAAVVRPVLRRVRAVVDRRFDRARYDAAQIVERFSHELRDELDVDALAKRLHRTAIASVQPTTGTVWIRDRG